jgi:CheY-like chemotaxis protein
MFPNFDNITRQLMSLEKPKKPKMLVVDDEPDNLDLLYRTFRRDFNVFRAESGVQALEILATEGEVAVIISDQRMPEMKGTEFLSKTVPDFPDTMRIILTGFTDVEDLVEAINSGQVYKYITKPWDPGELKEVVQKAAETYIVLKQRTEELIKSQGQTQLLATIMQVAQEVTDIGVLLNKIAPTFAENFGSDGVILQLVSGEKLTEIQGVSEASLKNWLNTDVLAEKAITNKNVQLWTNTATDHPESAEKYKNDGIQAHLVIPVIYQKNVLALLSIQWKTLIKMGQDELKFIHILAQEIGLVITSIKP